MTDFGEKKTTLCKLNKRGSILHFEVISKRVFEGATLVTRKGVLGGTMQEDIEPIYPKNVGRANETSPWEQCKMRANSKINKLGDKGYKIIQHFDNVDIKELGEYLRDTDGTDSLNRWLPMLAQKDTTKITFPGYLQRKYDGVRNLEKKEMGISLCRSRKGKLFLNLEHIEGDLPDLPKGWEWDGELYHHDRSLQQIVSMIKTKSPANLEIQYRVYDLINTGLPYRARKRVLHRLLRHAGPSVHKVPTHLVHNYSEVDALFEKFRKEKYEGAMWRDPDGLYECNVRSWGLIKVKDYEEDEFEIVGVEEATGRDEGTALFICQTDKNHPKAGVEFNVRPMGSRAVRAEYLDNFEEKYLGKMLTVRFQNYTDDGKPFHHRGVVVRNYE